MAAGRHEKFLLCYCAEYLSSNVIEIHDQSCKKLADKKATGLPIQRTEWYERRLYSRGEKFFAGRSWYTMCLYCSTMQNYQFIDTHEYICARELGGDSDSDDDEDFHAAYTSKSKADEMLDTIEDQPEESFDDALSLVSSAPFSPSPALSALSSAPSLSSVGSSSAFSSHEQIPDWVCEPDEFTVSCSSSESKGDDSDIAGLPGQALSAQISPGPSTDVRNEQLIGGSVHPSTSLGGCRPKSTRLWSSCRLCFEQVKPKKHNQHMRVCTGERFHTRYFCRLCAASYAVHEQHLCNGGAAEYLQYLSDTDTETSSISEPALQGKDFLAFESYDHNDPRSSTCLFCQEHCANLPALRTHIRSHTLEELQSMGEAASFVYARAQDDNTCVECLQVYPANTQHVCHL